MADTGITLGLSPYLPSAVAQMIGGGLAACGVYAVSRRAIFGADGSAAQGLGRYLAYSTAVIVAAGFALAWVSEQIPSETVGPLWGRLLLAKVLITPPILGINFLVAKWLSSQARGKSTKPKRIAGAAARIG
jgi:hypothetical protein